MFFRYFYLRRLIKMTEFKHVRLKSSIDKSNLPSKLRTESLSEILNCNIHTAREIISKIKGIPELSNYSFYLNASFCKEYLKLSDLIEFPSLLTLQPSLLQHRYFSLKELGFYHVTPGYLFRFPYLMKSTPQELKQRGFPFICEYKSDILDEYLNDSRRAEVNKKLHHMYQDGSDLQKIKETMNAEFFAEKLDCSIGRAYQMLKEYAVLRSQSISVANQLINVLYRCGFTPSKICNYLYLLSVHHKNIEHILSEFPEILGVDTLHLIRRVPHLLRQENEFIHKVQTIFKEFKISRDQLMCCPKVLSLAPSTLKKRLTAICSSEDFVTLKSNKKFLWLVYNYSNLNSRLKYLRAENMPCSINMFTVSKKTFEKYLLYNSTRIGIRETYTYLAEIFKMTEREMFIRLQHCSQFQSDCQNFSTVNCRRVIEYLLLSGVTKEQIFNGLEIVYFDIDVVRIYFNRLKRHPQCQPYEEWTSHYNFIQLLIYTIEVIKYHSYDMENDETDNMYVEFSSY